MILKDADLGQQFLLATLEEDARTQLWGGGGSPQVTLRVFPL